MQVWSWKHAIADSNLKPMTKLVLYTISNYMNSYGGGCYPSVSKIADQCGLKERATYSHINAAIAEGFLVKTKRNLRGSKWASNEYQAAYPEEARLQKNAPENGVHEDAGHKTWGASPCRSGVHEDAGLGCTTVHTISPDNNPKNSPIKNIKKIDFDPEDIEEKFETFWTNYVAISVGKGSKQEAKTIFTKLIKEGDDYDRIMQGLANYKQYTQSGGHYTKAVNRWLNKRGWEDDYTVSAPQRTTNQASGNVGDYRSSPW